MIATVSQKTSPEHIQLGELVNYWILKKFRFMHNTITFNDCILLLLIIVFDA